MSYIGTKPADQVSSSTIADGAVTTQKLAVDAINYVAPTGVVLPYGGSSAPTGWLLCNGSAISRSTYASLFTALGTTYGSGDGSTTFNLPDLQNKVPVGNGGGKTLGSTGGATTQTPTIGSTTLSVSQIPGHYHEVLSTGFAGTLGIKPATGGDSSWYGFSDVPEGGKDGSPAGSNSNVFANTTGGGGSHNHTSSSVSVEQPYVVLTYIIKS